MNKEEKSTIRIRSILEEKAIRQVVDSDNKEWAEHTHEPAKRVAVDLDVSVAWFESEPENDEQEHGLSVVVSLEKGCMHDVVRIVSSAWRKLRTSVCAELEKLGSLNVTHEC